jgi:urea carboxylase-associated protein 2
MSPNPDDLAAVIAARRARYDELKRRGQDFAPRALPPLSSLPAPAIADGAVIHRETIPGGWYWTTTLRRGEALRLGQSAGPSAVALLAWRLDDPSERLNHADTVKVQWTSALRKGRVLLSDMGRVLLSIIEDSSGAHDPLAGGSTAASNRSRYGEGSYRNTRDNFVLAAGKLGLTRRDIPPFISFFAPVGVRQDGSFDWYEDRRRPGDFVDLRAEMDLMVALSNCPHPLDPNPVYAPLPVDIVRFRAEIATDDICRTATAEAIRAFENTDAAFAGEQA